VDRRGAFVASALVVLVLLASRDAFAQACCAGASTLTPARLTALEDAAVGVQLQMIYNTGSFDGQRNYIPNPPGAGEQDFAENVFGTVRLLKRGQVSLLVPFVQTRRTYAGAPGEPGVTEFGGGIGDINLGVRWDFLLAKETQYWPGVAVLAGLTVPTGKAPDQVQGSSTQATGIGAFQATGGLALEQAYGHILVNLTGLLTQRFERHVQTPGGTITETLGLQFAGLAAVGWAFHFNQGIALILSYSGEGNAIFDSQVVPGSGRESTNVGISGGTPLWEDWRFQGSLTDSLPISGLGRAQPIGINATASILRTF
jgi:hypothetical protein